MPRPRINPVSWRPAAAPSRARRRHSDVPLPPLDVVDVGGPGPEDVVVAGDGSVYTGTADGLVRRIRRFRDEPARVDVVADTGGRPLGVEWLPDGRLLVCDAERPAAGVGDDVDLRRRVAQEPDPSHEAVLGAGVDGAVTGDHDVLGPPAAHVDDLERGQRDVAAAPAGPRRRRGRPPGHRVDPGTGHAYPSRHGSVSRFPA